MVGRALVLDGEDLDEDVEVLLTLLPALVHRLRLYTQMIKGETGAVTTSVTRRPTTSKEEVDLRLVAGLLCFDVADDATGQLHLEVGLGGGSVRETRSVDLDVAAAVRLLDRKCAALSGDRRFPHSRTRRPLVPLRDALNRLLETIHADELDGLQRSRRERGRGEDESHGRREEKREVSEAEVKAKDRSEWDQKMVQILAPAFSYLDVHRDNSAYGPC